MRFPLVFGFVALVGATGCRSTQQDAPASMPVSPDGQVGQVGEQALERLKPGVWRGVLRSPGGELPFGLEIPADGSRPVILNAAERAPIDRIRPTSNGVIFEIDLYDAVIEGEWRESRLVGRWQKRARQGTSQLPFEATHGYPYRFKPDGSAPSTAGSSIAGTWSMTFTDEDGPFIGQAELQQEGTKVIGTILTTTGDYRYLEGDFGDGRLRLSTFDGAHAFLFTASVDDQGHLKGDFWSRDTYHATFVAQRKTDERALFDPYREVEVTAEDERMTFRFPDVDGRIVSSEDDRFRGKVVLIDIFGTWCPNCNDLAPLLVEWHKKYSGQGLEIVGLAFEFTDDVDDANDRLRAYVAHHDIPFPVLRAGVSDKDAASTRVPALERVKSYPTTVFIGRDGKISRVHSGFAGPATGDHYVQTVASMEAEIQRLLGAQSAD